MITKTTNIGVDATINSRLDFLKDIVNEKKILENTCPKNAMTNKTVTIIEYKIATTIGYIIN